MNILWICNVPFAHHYELLGKVSSAMSSGSWLYAAYEGMMSDKKVNLHIATCDNVTEYLYGQYNNSYFHILPGGRMNLFDHTKPQNKANCQYLLSESKPDLIILWGTESHLAYLISQMSEGIPKAVYMQGVVNSILSHYYDGVPTKYHLYTLQDWVFKLLPNIGINGFKKQAILENSLLKSVDAVIVENDWCEDQCKVMNPSLRIFRNKLPLRQAYFDKCWSIDKVERHTIFTNAGGHSIKGHHILFQALQYVKDVYPDIKVYIPGPKYLEGYKSVKHRSGYSCFLNKLIRAYDLQDNLFFLGLLKPEEMADYISRCNVYVMPSLVENHSSSLIEAMLVGAPCVSALVGGIGTLIQHKSNGLIYNSLEPESLAGQILRVFNDDELAIRLSVGAASIRESRKSDFGQEMLKITAGLLDCKSGN